MNENEPINEPIMEIMLNIYDYRIKSIKIKRRKYF